MSENVLKMPEGVASTGMVVDIQEAYINAMIALPAILAEILKEMVVVSDSLSVIALYAEKKGLDEGLIGPDDIDKGDEDEGVDAA